MLTTLYSRGVLFVASTLLWIAVGVPVFSFPLTKGEIVHAPVTKVFSACAFVVALSGSTDVDSLVTVEMSGIDAVPPAQYGKSAQEMRYLPGAIEGQMSLSEVIKEKVVTIQVLSLDPITPNQAVGQVFLDGTDIAEIMVSRGYAWVSSADPVNPKLKALELEAKAQKRGLWGMPEYAKRAPSDVVEEILPPPDTFGLLIYIFLGSIKGWRLALSVIGGPKVYRILTMNRRFKIVPARASSVDGYVNIRRGRGRNEGDARVRFSPPPVLSGRLKPS